MKNLHIVNNKIFNIEDEDNNNVVNIQENYERIKKEFYDYFEKNEKNNNSNIENENNFIDYEEFIEIIKKILVTNYN